MKPYVMKPSEEAVFEKVRRRTWMLKDNGQRPEFYTHWYWCRYAREGWGAWVDDWCGCGDHWFKEAGMWP